MHSSVLYKHCPNNFIRHFFSKKATQYLENSKNWRGWTFARSRRIETTLLVTLVTNRPLSTINFVLPVASSPVLVWVEHLKRSQNQSFCGTAAGWCVFYIIRVIHKKINVNTDIETLGSSEKADLAFFANEMVAMSGSVAVPPFSAKISIKQNKIFWQYQTSLFAPFLLKPYPPAVEGIGMNSGAKFSTVWHCMVSTIGLGGNMLM